MTWEYVFLTLLMLWNLYLSAVTLARAHRLSAQIAVLTLRAAEIAETVEVLDRQLRNPARPR